MAKTVEVQVRPWGGADNKVPLAYEVLGSPVRAMIHDAVDSMHRVMSHLATARRAKTFELKMDHLAHLKFMDQYVTSRRVEDDCGTSSLKRAEMELADCVGANPFKKKAIQVGKDTYTGVKWVAVKSSTPAPAVHLPFVLPASLMLRDLPELWTGNIRHLWTFKLDGTRMYMIFMRLAEQCLAFWVNRAGVVWALDTKNWKLPSSFYDGTVFDAELTECKGVCYYTIHDLYMSCGKVCGHLCKDYRIALTNMLLPTTSSSLAFSSEHAVRPDLVIRVKRYFATRDVAHLLDRVMPSLGEERVDGLIRDGSEDPASVPGHKFKVDNTIDLWLQLKSVQPGVSAIYELWAWDGRTRSAVRWSEHGLVSVPVGADFDQHSGKVAELRVHERDGKKWMTFVKLRDHEKKRPNDIRVVKQTVGNYREAIRLDELFVPELFEKGFTQREPTHAELFKNAAKVIQLRVAANANWTQSCPASQSLPLPPPLAIGTNVSLNELRKAWKIKCSPYSYESLLYTQSRVV